VEVFKVFAIIMYDVNAKRTNKVLKVCRKYLTWVQNSILEGEITESNLFKLKQEVRSKIVEGEDSVIIYTFRSMNYSNRETIGIKKGGEEIFL
jgi:CRISPR-associated protein Cas2